MKKALIVDILRKYMEEHVLNYGDGNAQSILEMLYVSYSEYNRFDTESMKAGFRELYDLLQSLSLKQIDKVIDVVSTLCYNHEMSGFTEGVKVGVQLADELGR